MFQSHEKKLFYLTAATLVFFLLVGFLLIYPQGRRLRQLNQQVFELRSALETKYEKTKHLHKSQVKLAEVKQTALALQSLFAKQGEEIKLIAALEKMAEKNNIQQQLNLAAASQPLAAGLNGLELQITAKGDFPNLMNYFSELEHNQYLISFSEINLGRGVPPSLTLFLKSRLYVRN